MGVRRNGHKALSCSADRWLPIRYSMIFAQRLSKRYGATLALDRLDLTVPSGAVFGLLGPNGSGKTTFIKLLLGLIFPDAGSIESGALAARQIGYLPERIALPPRSRIGEYLRLCAYLDGLRGGALDDAVAARLRQVGLDQVAGQRIGSCSKGMLQRLGLAVALIGDPPLLVLDEPMEGLDPAWQKTVRDLTGQLRRDGKTILLSTHRLSDVAELCDHVAILSQGQLKRAGALTDVLPLRERVVIEVDRVPQLLAGELATLGSGVAWYDSLVMLEGPGVAAKRDVLQLLLQAGVDVRGLRQERMTLEEVYLEAMRA